MSAATAFWEGFATALKILCVIAFLCIFIDAFIPAQKTDHMMEYRLKCCAPEPAEGGWYFITNTPPPPPPTETPQPTPWPYRPDADCYDGNCVPSWDYWITQTAESWAE